MSVPYYTLLVFDFKAKVWTPEFGDYAKEVVEQQALDDFEYDLTCILRTPDVSPESIARKIVELNSTAIHQSLMRGDFILSVEDFHNDELVDIANALSRTIDKYENDQGNITQEQHLEWRQSFDLICGTLSGRIERAGPIDIAYFVNMPVHY